MAIHTAHSKDSDQSARVCAGGSEASLDVYVSRGTFSRVEAHTIFNLDTLLYLPELIYAE